MANIKVEELNFIDPTGEIYIRKWTPEGQHNKTPLILVHDSLGSVELWKDFPLVLSQSLSRPVIAYDRLGFGKSSMRHDLPSVNFIKEEAHLYFPKVKTELALKEYIILGHSVGGGMAINIAAHDPDCIGVITVAAQAFVEDITIAGIKAAKMFFQQDEQVNRLKKWHGSKTQWVLNAWIEVWLSSEFSTWSLKECISNVNSPVLAIHGDKDEYGSSAFPTFIKENVSGYSDMSIIKNCGHAPHIEQSSTVTRLISQFIHQHIQ